MYIISPLWLCEASISREDLRLTLLITRCYTCSLFSVRLCSVTKYDTILCIVKEDLMSRSTNLLVIGVD